MCQCPFRSHRNRKYGLISQLHTAFFPQRAKLFVFWFRPQQRLACDVLCHCRVLVSECCVPGKNVWVLPTNTFCFLWSTRIISGNRNEGNYALSFLTEKVWSTWVSASKKRPAYSDYFKRKMNEILKVASIEKIFTGRTWSHGRHDHEACAIASESYYTLQHWTCNHNITGARKLLRMSCPFSLCFDAWCRGVPPGVAAGCCWKVSMSLRRIRGRVSGCCPKYRLLSEVFTPDLQSVEMFACFETGKYIVKQQGQEVS